MILLPDTYSVHTPFPCFLQASLDHLSQRATDSPSRLGQTTCTLLSNTPSRRCGPSRSACGCDPQREASGRLCLTPFLHNPTSWCCCRACTPQRSCSSMTRCSISQAVCEAICPLLGANGFTHQGLWTALWLICQTISRLRSQLVLLP